MKLRNVVTQILLSVIFCVFCLATGHLIFFGWDKKIHTVFAAQIPAIELACPAGTTTFPGIGQVIDPSTNLYRQWLCYSTINGAITINDGIISNTFTISNQSCSGSCLTLVANDSTDNCGTALTNFLTTVGNYAGPDFATITINPSTTGLAYKFITCSFQMILSQTEPGLGIQVYANGATIDCGQTTVSSCIQMGLSGQVASGAWTKTYKWYGGAFTGGQSSSATPFNVHWCQPFMATCVTDNTHSNNAEPVGSTLGGCSKGYFIFVDKGVNQAEAANNIIGNSGTGWCGVGNSNQVTGQNTMRTFNNTISNNNSGNCGSVGIDDGGFSTYQGFNNIHGLAVPIWHDYNGNEVGANTVHNTIDNVGCQGASDSAPCAMEAGASGYNGTIGPVVMDGNDIQGGAGRSTYLFCIAGVAGASASYTSTTVTNNHASLNTVLIMPNGTKCTVNTVSARQCQAYGNLNFYTQQSNNNWSIDNPAQAFYFVSSAQTANLGATTVYTTGTTVYSRVTTLRCLEWVTVTGTGTVPSCVFSWTDIVTSHAATCTLAPTIASFATSQQVLGQSGVNVCNAHPSIGSTISLSTTGYTATGTYVIAAEGDYN